MASRTVTYDDATHVVAPKRPTWEMMTNAIDGCGIIKSTEDANGCWEDMIAAAPPFTSLPNPDLDVIEEVFADMAIDGSVHPVKFAKAIAALKRIKRDI